MTSTRTSTVSTDPILKAPLLNIKDLSIRFPMESGYATAVNQLNLTLEEGMIMGLVGESGCGKSLSSLAILNLIPQPGQISSGEIYFNQSHPDIENLAETNLLSLPTNAIRKIRGAKIAIIPQDPLTSLNPVYTIGQQINEVLALHQNLYGEAADKKAIELLDQVRLPNAKDRIKDYPHQFSGGMRQRVMIAMALSCSPALLIADEPTTALDVTVQAQILQLMRDIQKENNSAILLITHDLGVVAEMCERVAVMYAGRIVEEGQVHDLFKSPLHPYTQGLLNSLPTVNRSRLEPIDGQPPSISEIPSGCAFEPRCKNKKDDMPQCTQDMPPITVPTKENEKAHNIDSKSHSVRCHLY